MIIPKTSKNVVSVGVSLPLYYYGYGRPIEHCGYKINYEHVVRKTNPIVFCVGGGYITPPNFTSPYHQYCSKISYRFYNTKTNKSINYFYKKPKSLTATNGFYFSIDATMRGEFSISDNYKYYNYRYGFGGGKDINTFFGTK